MERRASFPYLQVAAYLGLRDGLEYWCRYGRDWGRAIRLATYWTIKANKKSIEAIDT